MATSNEKRTKAYDQLAKAQVLIEKAYDTLNSIDYGEDNASVDIDKYAMISAALLCLREAQEYRVATGKWVGETYVTTYTYSKDLL